MFAIKFKQDYGCIGCFGNLPLCSGFDNPSTTKWLEMLNFDDFDEIRPFFVINRWLNYKTSFKSRFNFNNYLGEQNEKTFSNVGIGCFCGGPCICE